MGLHGRAFEGSVGNIKRDDNIADNKSVASYFARGNSNPIKYEGGEYL